MSSTSPALAVTLTLSLFRFRLGEPVAPILAAAQEALVANPRSSAYVAIIRAANSKPE